MKIVNYACTMLLFLILLLFSCSYLTVYAVIATLFPPGFWGFIWLGFFVLFFMFTFQKIADNFLLFMSLWFSGRSIIPDMRCTEALREKLKALSFFSSSRWQAAWHRWRNIDFAGRWRFEPCSTTYRRYDLGQVIEPQ